MADPSRCIKSILIEICPLLLCQSICYPHLCRSMFSVINVDVIVNIDSIIVRPLEGRRVPFVMNMEACH